MIEFNALASGSTANAYVISDGRTKFLLEAGLPIRELKKRLGFRLNSITAALVSHQHGDHAKGMRDIMRAGVDVYTSTGTANALSLSGHRLHLIKAHQQFAIGSWIILPFETIHDCEEPLGFLLANRDGDKVLFATDTFYLQYKFRGLTHVFIEANYSKAMLRAAVESGLTHPEVAKRIRTNHMSIEGVEEMLQANDISQVEMIVLLHISDAHSDEEEFIRTIQTLTGRPTYAA